MKGKTMKKAEKVPEEKSKGGFKERRKECLTSANKIPTVDIKGKKYSTVNERHRHLLQYFPEARFNEEILFHDNERVVVKTELFPSSFSAFFSPFPYFVKLSDYLWINFI